MYIGIYIYLLQSSFQQIGAMQESAPSGTSAAAAISETAKQNDY